MRWRMLEEMDGGDDSSEVENNNAFQEQMVR
jgi:hypothetical protein